MADDDTDSVSLSSPNNRKAGCTFAECAKGLLEKDVDQLSKRDRGHVLRAHTDTPLKIRHPERGITLVFLRNPNRSMKYVCPCTKAYLVRESLTRHYAMCKAMDGANTNEFLKVYPCDTEQTAADHKKRSHSEQSGKKGVGGTSEKVRGTAATRKQPSNMTDTNDITAAQTSAMIVGLQNTRQLVEQMIQQQNQMIQKEIMQLRREVQELRERGWDFSSATGATTSGTSEPMPHVSRESGLHGAMVLEKQSSYTLYDQARRKRAKRG